MRWLSLFLVALPACGGSLATYGLHPIEPEQRMEEWSAERSWPLVDPRPTLAWLPFPSRFDRTVLGEELVERAEDVTYDLVVIRVDPPAKVYEVLALPEPKHALEVELEPGEQYYWSVRARFVLDGRTCVTRWARFPDPREHLLGPDGALEGALVISYDDFFRMRTEGR